jgi:TolA-binding protein
MKCAALSLLVLTGCFVPITQGKAIQGDLRLLRDRLVAIEDRAEADDAQLRQRVAQAQADAERIAETMAKVDKIARRADANFGEDLEAMRRAVGSLQGRLETVEHQRGQAAEANPELEKMRQDMVLMNNRITALEKALGERKVPVSEPVKLVKGIKKVVKVTPIKKVEKKEPTADDSSRSLFRGAKEALRTRRYGRAQELMQRWVKLYAKQASKRSAADDAYVVIGEALQGQKKYKKAIHAFQKVYKMGVRKADMWTKAVFRMGESFESLGDKAGARAFYKMANSKGSGHFAKKSGQRLKRLR